MDFLKGKIRPIYFRYLAAAFGSAMITSVYSVVDTAMVGQYHGPRQHGGSCRGGPGLEHHLQPGPADGHWRQRDLQHQARQRPAGRQRKSVFHRFRTGVPGSCAAGLGRASPAGRAHSDLLGADEGLLVLARRYLRPMKFVVPLFLFNQMLAAFLVSVAWGLVLSGILILILPALRREALWLAVRKRTMDKAPTMPRRCACFFSPGG